tara:strand:+ start:85 stop:216 length:132 start_codon:yes stop_codon:yes gene_type:complete
VVITVVSKTGQMFVEVKQAKTSGEDLKDNKRNSVVATEPLEKT